MKMEDMILVSIDDHVVEPSDAFLPHYPAAKKDRAPRIIDRDGADVWVWNDTIYPTIGRPLRGLDRLSAAADVAQRIAEVVEQRRVLGLAATCQHSFPPSLILAIAQQEGFEVCALSFDYGQRHSREVKGAEALM